jgi:hypothetical protein
VKYIQKKPSPSQGLQLPFDFIYWKLIYTLK